MSNAISGKKRALIVATEHPEGLMKAKVRLLSLWDGLPEDALPWAEYHLPVGGAFAPSIVGDLVWVEFPYDGDSRYPMITGAAQDAPNGVPNVAPEASGQGGAYQPPAIEGAPPRPILTPTKDFVEKRNKLLIIRSAGGGASITNTETGTSIGMNEAGDVFHIVKGDYFLNVTGAIKMKSTGKITMESGSGFDAKAPQFDFTKK